MNAKNHGCCAPMLIPGYCGYVHCARDREATYYERAYIFQNDS